MKGTGNDLSLDLKYAGTAGAYPALLVTYEIACSKGLAVTTAIVGLPDLLLSPETRASCRIFNTHHLQPICRQSTDLGRSDPIVTSPRGRVIAASDAR